MKGHYVDKPIVVALIVAGALFLVMGWPSALGGGVGTYWAAKYRAKRT